MVCNPFISLFVLGQTVLQVLEALFEEKYWTLSGSMQRTLLRLTSTAKDIGKQHIMYNKCLDALSIHNMKQLSVSNTLDM